MITMALFSIMWMTTNILKTTNPMKLSMMILISSTFLFMMMMKLSGAMWMPSIFILIFMGGIIMMFMILSSVSPNEPTKKLKFSALPLMLTLCLTYFMSSNLSEQTQMMMKQNINSMLNIFFISMLIMMYFFSFIWVLSIQKSSMRTMSCFIQGNFVICQK